MLQEDVLKAHHERVWALRPTAYTFIDVLLLLRNHYELKDHTFEHEEPWEREESKEESLTRVICPADSLRLTIANIRPHLLTLLQDEANIPVHRKSYTHRSVGSVSDKDA